MYNTDRGRQAQEDSFPFLIFPPPSAAEPIPPYDVPADTRSSNHGPIPSAKPRLAVSPHLPARWSRQDSPRDHSFFGAGGGAGAAKPGGPRDSSPDSLLGRPILGNKAWNSAEV